MILCEEMTRLQGKRSAFLSFWVIMSPYIAPQVVTSTQFLLHMHYSSITIRLFRILEYHLLSCCMVDNSVTTYLLSLMLSKSDKNGSNWLKTESAHLHNDTYSLWRHTTSTPDHFMILRLATMSWYKTRQGISQQDVIKLG